MTHFNPDEESFSRPEIESADFVLTDIETEAGSAGPGIEVTPESPFLDVPVTFLETEYPEEVSEDRALPSLLNLLEHSHTVHSHKYGETTVRDDLKLIKQKDPENLTEHEQKLKESVDVITQFAGFSTLYQYVYTATEVYDLASKLSLLQQKNRPDFDGVEGDLIDVCSALLRGDPSNYDGDAKKIRGIIQRATQDTDKRRGMQFPTMVSVAQVANDILGDSFKSEERREYLVHVTDPEKAKVTDLSSVYQFVVNYNAYQILLERSRLTSQMNAEVFVANCDIINQYFDEFGPLLDEIPSDVRLEQKIRVFRTGRTGTRMHRPKEFLLHLKAKMNERLENGAAGSGGSKGYKLDPMGAYKLQRLIGHSIETVNNILTQPPETEETRIIPLDDLDLD